MAAEILSNLYKVGDVTDPLNIEAMRHRICTTGLAIFEGAHDARTMLAAARQLFDIARRGVHRAVAALDLPDAVGAQGQRLAVDEEPAVAHLQVVARQADDDLRAAKRQLDADNPML